MNEERRDEEIVETGRKGGSAAMSTGAYMPAREAVAFWTRDLVRWGPIWAGLLLALGIQIVLGAIGLAVALSSYSPTAADFATRVASMASIWSVISAVIALFIGGFVAGRMAAVLGLKNGLIQGSVVWSLALVIGVILSAVGVAGMLGATNMTPFLTRGLSLTSPEQVNVIRGAAASTWWFVIGAIVAWAAAATGGLLGAAARTEAIEER